MVSRGTGQRTGEPYDGGIVSDEGGGADGAGEVGDDDEGEGTEPDAGVVDGDGGELGMVWS